MAGLKLRSWMKKHKAWLRRKRLLRTEGAGSSVVKPILSGETLDVNVPPLRRMTQHIDEESIWDDPDGTEIHWEWPIVYTLGEKFQAVEDALKTGWPPVLLRQGPGPVIYPHPWGPGPPLDSMQHAKR